MDQLHRQHAGLTEGQVASYIPELAKADPAGFGIAIATVDGQVYQTGDARRVFSIQSVSKPFVYGVALEDAGRARVERAIGVEPTGDVFNSISLESGSGRPLNPMINAGAIAASSLVAGASAAARLARVLGALSAYAGRPLDVDEAIFESERSTGHRNRAIGHMLRHYDIIGGDPEPALELYFKQCAVRVDCRDLALMAATLALMAATLANGGVNPATSERAVRHALIEPILSVMTTCGMYDYSGAWVYRVGLPAKSGVGGGIIAVLPGQLGIGLYSPALEGRGNSARAAWRCASRSRPSWACTACSRRGRRWPRCGRATRWPMCGPSGGGRRPRAGCSTPRVTARWSSSCRATCASPRWSRCCVRSSTPARRSTQRCSTSSGSAMSTATPPACWPAWPVAAPRVAKPWC